MRLQVLRGFQAVRVLRDVPVVLRLRVCRGVREGLVLRRVRVGRAVRVLQPVQGVLGLRVCQEVRPGIAGMEQIERDKGLLKIEKLKNIEKSYRVGQVLRAVRAVRLHRVDQERLQVREVRVGPERKLVVGPDRTENF